MSDFILKLWPKNQTNTNNRELIDSEFKARGLVAEKVEHWSGESYKGTSEIKNFLDYDFVDNGQYSASLIINISEKNYGIRDGEEDVETFDRNNVVSIYEGDGSIINWEKFANLLKKITGDEYEGGWEIL